MWRTCAIVQSFWTDSERDVSYLQRCASVTLSLPLSFPVYLYLRLSIDIYACIYPSIYILIYTSVLFIVIHLHQFRSQSTRDNKRHPGIFIKNKQITLLKPWDLYWNKSLPFPGDSGRSQSSPHSAPGRCPLFSIVRCCCFWLILRSAASLAHHREAGALRPSLSLD